MTLVLFLIKHTPFWSVPLALISAQFAYLYWLKDVRQYSYAFGCVILFCIGVTLFYIVAGGPDKAPEAFLRFVTG